MAKLELKTRVLRCIVKDDTGVGGGGGGVILS